MRGKRTRIRRRQPTDRQRKPFFDKLGSEEAAPFFAGPKGIQTKLAIGKANDPLEKEADAAVRQVVSQQQVQRAGQKDEEPAILGSGHCVCRPESGLPSGIRACTFDLYLRRV